MKTNAVGKIAFLLALISAGLCACFSNTCIQSRQASVSGFRFIKSADGFFEYELEKNGLRVLVKEDHSSPVVTTLATYFAGFRTGGEKFSPQVQHLLEHMVMKSTEKYNRNTNVTAANVLQQAGALMNATTEQDRTDYYETLPSNRLDLSLDVQAQRMRHVIFLKEDIDREKQVIQSELASLAGSPEIMLRESVWRAAFRKHPYRRSVILDRSDIQKITREQVREFYDTYYWPNNACLTVIGDFNTKHLLSLVEKKFGALTRSPQLIPTDDFVEPEQKKPRRIRVMTNDPDEIVILAHKTPPMVHTDTFPLQVLSHILSGGRQNRLNQSLVDAGIAIRAASEEKQLHDPGLFITSVVLAPHTRHKDAERAVLEVYEDIKKNGVGADEIERAKNQLRMELSFARDGSFAMARGIGDAIGGGDWALFPQFLEKINQVSADDIKRVANLYLVPSKMTVGYLISKKVTGRISKKPRTKPFHRPDQAKAITLEHRAANDKNSAAEEKNHGSKNDWKRGFSRRANVTVINGIKVICLRTGAKDIVSIAGFFEGAGAADSRNQLLPELTALMLGKQTRKFDPNEILQILESRGIQISFQTDYKRLIFHAGLLKEHVPLAIKLIADELREPVFGVREFRKAKQQMRAAILQKMSDPFRLGYSEFKRLVYLPPHPLYEIQFQGQLQKLRAITLRDVLRFYRQNYVFQNFVIVAVGDIDTGGIHEAVQNEFRGLEIKNAGHPYDGSALNFRAGHRFIPVKGKESLQVFIGHAMPLNQKSVDYQAAYLAHVVFGGDFSARILTRLREELGLTYRAYSFFSGMDDDVMGAWVVHAISPAGTLNQLIDEAKKQISLFVEKGITAEELAQKKGTIVGRFQVSLASTGNLAEQILEAEKLKLDVAYLDQFPKLVNRLTLKEVNRAIRRYFHPEQLTTVVAGDVRKNSGKL